MAFPATRHSVILTSASADPEARRQAFAAIMLPGGAVGLIVGYATYTYPDGTEKEPQSA